MKMLPNTKFKKLIAREIIVSKFKLNLFGTVMLILGAVIGSYLTVSKLLIPLVYASDTSHSWDFSTSSDYTFSDSTLIETAASSARLKVRNYASDSNTSLLLHLDESTGNPADSSSNSNTATANSVTYSTGNLNNAATFNGTSSYISVADSTSTSLSQKNTIEGWVKFNNTFNSTSHNNHQGIIDKGEYRLYYNYQTGKLQYELADAASTSWTQQAGNDIKSSWDLNGKTTVDAQTVIGTDLYVGLGTATGDAEVWKWDSTNSSWTMIGGDGVNSSWADQTFESVLSMSTDGTNLYAGLGTGSGDAEVWKWNGSSWTKIGGDAVNSSWAVNTYEGVYSMTYTGGTLYVGLGVSANDAEVWSWNGTTWTKIGGDSTNSGWTTNFEAVYSLTNDGSYIYAGLGSTAGDAEVWRYSISGGTWSRIGGDGINSGWADSTFEQVLSMTYQGSTLYAGLGTSAGDAEVWSWNGSAWTQIGGDGTNSSWNTNYEGVYSLRGDGTNLYAGLGATAGDNEVWKWNGSSWSQIGGDALNSGFTNTHTIVNTLSVIGTTVYAGLNASNTSSEIWSWNGSAWAQIGGNYVNKSWGFYGLHSVESMTVAGDTLYAGTGVSTAGNALVWSYDGSTWTLIGGQGVNGSWAAKTYESVTSMISYKGKLYVGLGVSANDAELWEWNPGGSTWTQIGGDSLNSGWTTNYERVASLAVYNDNLYAGLGQSANDAEVWKWNGTSWTKVGGDSTNSGWTSGYETVLAMGVYQGDLYAGLGSTAGDSEVWKYNGTSWVKVGGDSTNSGWDNTIEQVNYLLPYNGKLYAALGTTTDDAEVWEYDGSSWSKIGGDDLNSSWTSGTYEEAKTLTAYNGNLYAGLGTGTGDGEVWEYDGSTWSKIGGNSVNSSWTNAVEYVSALSVFQGKLYTGLGSTANTDAMVWSYGNNAVLKSVSTSQDTNWHHIAATYDGSTMKLYIDGTLNNSTSASLSLPDTIHPTLIGTTYGARESGIAQGYFDGSIDEVRISDIDRSSFTTAPYATTAQTIYPTTAVLTSQIKSYDAFTASETANGGTITYRLSNDGGANWKYYTGGAWTTSASTTQANNATTINTNITTFPVGTGGIIWQAILSGDGTQQVTLNSVTIDATSDTTAPIAPSSLTALDSSGGSTALSTDTWYAHSTPYFSWSGASDTGGSGIAGYYVYFGADATADPQTAGSFQTTTNYTASSLTSGNTYYLRIKAKDNAQNTSTIYSAFIYKFDNTAPGNPTVITISPSGYTATNNYTFTWASDAADGGAGISGYQYKTATASGTLSDWSETITETHVTIPDAAYQNGSNTFYLRTIDSAGNISSTPLQATYYFSGSAPSGPQDLAVNPLVNSSANSFAFSWTAPATFNGNASDLTYCYTVNVLPSADNCTFTSAGATSLSASSFATQPGTNTFYLVAKDGTDNISYTSYATVEFTYSGSAPGIPRNVDVGDISIKSTSNWKLALTWDAPAEVGAGVDSYKVYRSATATSCSDDFSSFTLAGSTSGTSFADANLTQTTYNYCVKACDSANSCSAVSSTKSGYPTGKYISAAGLSSGPTISGLTTKQAKVSWSTDRASDSKISYGTTPGTYLDSEPSNSSQTTDHTISLTNLSPGTTYYYKAKWTDEDGNTGTSEEKSFTTDPSPTVTDPKVRRAGLSDVDLEFKLKGASKVKIYYGLTSAFGGFKELETSTNEATYTASIDGLNDGAKYFYKINTFDSEGNEYEGSILSFETVPRPKISNVRIQEVRGTAQTTVIIGWNTNTETSSVVSYYPENNPQQSRDEVNVTLKKDLHRITIRSLLPQTNYTLIVKGRDKSGNEAQSEPQKFTTSTDTRPPQISDLRIEGSTVTNKGNTQEQTAQLTVSWNTDEPATSQVEFGEGTGSTYSQKTQEDSNLSLNHVVVISGLTPSKVYHLHAVNKDSASNIGYSVDTVTITPKATDSALDLVVKNLQSIFGAFGAKSN